MPAIYQGDKKIVDRYIGETLVTRAYQGDKLIFDAYSELSDTLPLYVRSRASQILENYIIYGTASGAGVQTVNLWDFSASTIGLLQNDGSTDTNQNYSTSDYIPVTAGQPYTFRALSGYAPGRFVRVAWYDSDRQCVDYSDAVVAAPIGSVITRSYTAPNNASYARVSGFSLYDSEFMFVLGSTAPSYIPYGYKLPLTVRTKNLWDANNVAQIQITSDASIVRYGIAFSGIAFSMCLISAAGPIYYKIKTGDNYDAPIELSAGVVITLTLTANQTLLVYGGNPTIVRQAVIQINSGTTYIPYYNTETPIYIGDSQLMEGEYVDYEEQKVYKLVDGVLTPTDPPVPLPDISLPQDEVTIDTEEEFKCHSTIKGRINPVHYAYSINADTAEITYLADNKNFTPAAMGSTTFNYGSWGNAFFIPRPCMLKSDGKVDYYLDPNDYSKKLDGTASDIADPTYDGNVMLEFSKIYYKFVPTGDDGEGGTFHCSNVKIDDSYECWCNYDANNNEIDHFYVHAYNAVILDGKMRSLSGYALTQENGADTTTGPAEIAAARANNQNGIDEWYTYLISDHQLLTHLATLMCKHVNHQAKFGRGIDSGSAAAKRAYVTGTLNDKGLFWGDTSTGTQAVKIFGIENFYACVWKRAAGLIGTSTGYSYKLTHGTKDGSTATSFNTNGRGYKTIARTKPANGYVTTMHYETNGFWIPATTGTNRYAVYHWTGNGYVLVGGGSSSGSNYGSWYVDLTAGVSNSNWGISSALSCKPRASASSHNT